MKKIEIKGVDEYIYEDVCDNGLRVFVWPSENVKSVFMTLNVKYGSIHTSYKVDGVEKKVPNGTAHFLEHIKFNEENGVAHDYFQSLGADANAFTTFDYTSYIVYAMKNIDLCLEHLLDFVQTPFFNDEMIEKEKGIIIQEYKMGRDRAENVALFEFLNCVYDKFPMKYLITGNDKDIKSINVDNIKDVFDNFYVPENMFLCVTGNVNPEEIMEIVKNNQKKKKFNKFKAEVIFPDEQKEVMRKEMKSSGNVTIPLCKYGIKIPRDIFNDYDCREIRVYLRIFASMLFSNTSDFRNDIINSNIANSFECSVIDDPKFYHLIFSFDSINADEVVKRIKNELNNIQLNDRDFNRKIKSRIANYILEFEDGGNVNYLIQDYIITDDKIVDNVKELYEKLSMYELSKIIKKIDFSNSTYYVMNPKV